MRITSWKAFAAISVSSFHIVLIAITPVLHACRACSSLLHQRSNHLVYYLRLGRVGRGARGTVYGVGLHDYLLDVRHCRNRSDLGAIGVCIHRPDGRCDNEDDSADLLPQRAVNVERAVRDNDRADDL